MAAPVLLILCGLPFAGKTTLARLFEEKGFKRVTVDDINIELGIGFSLEKRITHDEWTKAYTHYYKRIRTLLQKGKSVICDGVAYMQREREELRSIARSCYATSYVVYVPTGEKVVKERWIQNKQSKIRQDIREDDFEEVIQNFQYPTVDEHVLIVDNQHADEQTIVKITQNL